MANTTNENSIIIIGAGFAGLSAGIYAQMNGFKSRIIEMHDKPGGLCTSWNRNGYTFDGCIHWLVGSNPQSAFNRYWEEVGIAQGREFINMDEYMRLEGSDERTLIFYNDVDRLEKHLLDFSPQDAAPIKEFISGIRMCTNFNQPSKKASFLHRMRIKIKLGLTLIINGRKIHKWMKITAEDFSGRFKDPLLSEAFKEMWIPEFSILFMLFTFSYLHNKNAGYPIGGSMPMSEALANRYVKIGGEIYYGKKVEKIIVENNKAVGVRLSDESEHRAERIVSAADGHSTIFRMLEGKYIDGKILEMYEKWPIFQPLIFVGIGVNRSFNEEPLSVSGFSYPLRDPVKIGDTVRNRLWIHIFNHDPSMAPENKTTIVVMLSSVHSYWKKLAEDKNAYIKEKEEISKTIVEILEQRFPGIKSQIEVIDVATPLTFERYTGNWQGSFEGWLITPENSGYLIKKMSQRLPGLTRFYMCGQWVEPGGGLPTGVISGRRLIKSICKEERKKFITLSC